MENFSPFAAAFKAGRGFVRTLSCTETGEVEAQQEGCEVSGEQIMRNRGELGLVSSSPSAASAHRQSPGSKFIRPIFPQAAAARPPPARNPSVLAGPQREEHAGCIREQCSSHSIQGRCPKASMGQNHLLRDIPPPPPRLLPRRQPESLPQPAQMPAAKMTACPLRVPFCFFNTIKRLHTVWTLETLTALAETRAAAQAFNSFKWHHSLSRLRPRIIPARCRHPPHR